MKLSDFKVLTFDCYGTLIDWESGMLAGLKPLTDQLSHELSADEILNAHGRHESTQQAYTPTMVYHDVLSIVYKRLAEEWGVPISWDECLTYGQSVQHWPAFPDSAEALRYLKEHYKLVILSNVDNKSFAASNAKLGVSFDAIYTAQDIGSYKPADANFDYMLRHLSGLGLEKRDILHTAESMFHDHQPANRHGLANCWIYRRYDKEGFGATMNPGEMPSYNFQFNSMGEMAEAHQSE
ncbi:MAG: haloacid dehalogenase type II [Anaerolineae bacterium]